MIFAPRSWPSRPGLAITTRVVLATWEYMEVRLRSSARPRLAEPGRAQSGYLIEAPERSCSTAAPASSAALREAASRDIDRVTHFHLDHWGDLVPVGLGLSGWGRPEEFPPPRSGFPAGSRARRLRLGLGMPEMFRVTFGLARSSEAGPRRPCSRIGSRPWRVPHYGGTRHVRLPRPERRAAARLLGRLCARGTARRARARSISSSARHASRLGDGG